MSEQVFHPIPCKDDSPSSPSSTSISVSSSETPKFLRWLYDTPTLPNLVSSTPSLSPAQSPAIHDIDNLISLMSFNETPLHNLYDKLQNFYKQHSKELLQEENEDEKIKLCQFLGAFIVKHFNFDCNAFKITEIKNKTDTSILEKIEISDDKQCLIIEPKLKGAEFGAVITDLINNKTWYLKIAKSKDTMAGLAPKLQEQKMLKVIGEDVAVVPQILIIDENKGIIENPKPNDATDKNVAIMMTESSFDCATDIDSSNVTIPKDDKHFQKQFNENFLKLITGIVLDGSADSGLGNWSFEYYKVKEELKRLTGGIKLIDTMSDKSEGEDKQLYTDLFKIKEITILDCHHSKVSKPADRDNIFNKLLYIFKYTQSFKGQNSESYFMPYVLNDDALYDVFTSYCQEHQDEMMSYLIKDCVIPFLDRVNNSTELSDEEKLDCFRRFVFIDNYCGNEFTKIMAPNYYLKIKEGSTFEDLTSEIAEYIDKKDEYLERVDGVLETRKEIEFKNRWLDYTQNRKEQEEETERVLSR